MGRPLRFIALTLALVLLLGLLAVFLMGKGISSGVLLVSEQGSYILVLDGSPVVLDNRTGRDDAFAHLNTGDRIWILHDGIRESYPGQTGVYFFLRLSSGNTEEIPTDLLDSLRELGWMP